MAARSRRSAGGALVLSILVSVPVLIALAGQQASQQPPLKYEISVTLKLVQVYVTDKSGKPVRDLTRDEFTVTDNGRPVTI
jgi:hypothetical protein